MLCRHQGLGWGLLRKLQSHCCVNVATLSRQSLSVRVHTDCVAWLGVVQHCARPTFSCATADKRARTSGFAISAFITSGLRMCGGMRAIIICMTVGFSIMTSIMRLNWSSGGPPELLGLSSLPVLVPAGRRMW